MEERCPLARSARTVVALIRNAWTCREAAPGVDPLALTRVAVEEFVNARVKLVRVANAEGSNGAGRIDENVRRHSADSQLRRVFPGLVQKDGSLDAPEIAVVLRSLMGVATFPDVDQDHVQTGPACLASAQLLE